MSTAIRHGATGVMLSGETASGTYPLETVQTMARIVKATEDGLDDYDLRPTSLAQFRSTRPLLTQAWNSQGKRCFRIIVATEHGTSPRLVSGYRPNIPVTAVSDRLRALATHMPAPGVDAVLSKEHERGSKTMKEAVNNLWCRAESSQVSGSSPFRAVPHARCDQYASSLQDRRIRRNSDTE